MKLVGIEQGFHPTCLQNLVFQRKSHLVVWIILFYKQFTFSHLDYLCDFRNYQHLFYIKLILNILFNFMILIMTTHKHLTKDWRLIFDYPCPRTEGNPLGKRHSKLEPGFQPPLDNGHCCTTSLRGLYTGARGHSTHRQRSVFNLSLPFYLLTGP